MTGLKVLMQVQQCSISSENFILFKYYNNFQIKEINNQLSIQLTDINIYRDTMYTSFMKNKDMGTTPRSSRGFRNRNVKTEPPTR